MKPQMICMIGFVMGSAAVASAAPPAATSTSGTQLEARWRETLDKEIARLNRGFKGRISVFASDAHLAVRYTHDVDTPSYLASGVKVPFMIEVFRQAEQGLLSMDETLTYDESSIRDGAPKLNRRALGSKITIRDLLRLMVQHSDNAASDMLAGRVGLENVNAGLRAAGLMHFNRLTYLIDVRRGIFRELDLRGDDLTNLEIRKVRWTWGWQAHTKVLTDVLGKPPGNYRHHQLHEAYRRFYATGVNHARVDDVGRMMEKMVAGELVSQEASAEMLAIMLGSKTSRNRMIGKLPRGAKVAHKTGSQFERICDYGVIYLPDDRPLIFAACLGGGASRTLAEATLASIARKTYDLAAAAHRRQGAVTK